jgi:hypothetical protein
MQLNARISLYHSTGFVTVEVFFWAHEGLVTLTDEQVSTVSVLRVVAVHHVPVVADHHSLLEERLVGTCVCKASPLGVTHVVQLPTVHLK